jgi:hypothetical protein
MQHLSDESGPDPLQDDLRLGRPEQVQIQLPFDELDRQLKVSAARIEDGDTVQ